MTFRIAVVQPIANPLGRGREERRRRGQLHRRAPRAEGADFVCFPETYPGPWRMPATFDPTPRIAEAAAKHGINAVYGTIEPLSHNEGTAHNLICMAYGDGRAPVSYRRTHPNGPWIYTGGKWWEFQYVPGNEFPVFDTPHGKVGLADVQRGLYAGSDARAGAARRRTDLHAGRHRQRATVGDLAQSDLVARDRKPRHRGHHAESVQPLPSAGWRWWRRRRRSCSRAPRPGCSSSTSASTARAKCAPSTRHGHLFAELRRQAGRARPAMAAAGTARAMYPRPPTRRSKHCAGRASVRISAPHVPSPRSRPQTAPWLHATAASSAPPSAAPTTRRLPN